MALPVMHTERCSSSPVTDQQPTKQQRVVCHACPCVVLQVSHVLRQIPPRPDSLSRLPGHKAFLNTTVALARGAECVAAVGQDVVAQVPVNAVNQNQFWKQQ